MPVRLGLNVRASGRSFGTVADAFSRDSAYWGEHENWYAVAAKTRDGGALDESNFAVLKDRLGDAAVVEGAGHWACGWVDYLLIPPNDRKAIRTAVKAHRDYELYPVLDDEHFSNLEYEKFWSFAESELGSFDGWEDAVRAAEEEAAGGIGDDGIEWEIIEAARAVLESAQHA